MFGEGDCQNLMGLYSFLMGFDFWVFFLGFRVLGGDDDDKKRVYVFYLRFVFCVS